MIQCYGIRLDENIHLVCSDSEANAKEYFEQFYGLLECEVKLYSDIDVSNNKINSEPDDECLYNHGWELMCNYCQEYVTEDPVFHLKKIYCSQNCLEDCQFDKELLKNLKEEAQNYLLKKYPFVSIDRVFNGARNCNCFRENYNNVTVEFSFGSKFPNAYCHGCKKIWICNGNLEKWKALAHCNTDQESKQQY